MTGLAALAAALTVWLLVRPGATGLGRLAEEPPPVARRPGPWLVAALAGGLVVVVAGVFAGPRAAVIALAVAMVAGCGATVMVRVRARAARAAKAADVAWAGEVLAGLLRAGHVPATALLEAASEATMLREAADALRVGGDVPEALRRSAGRPGCGGLADLADAWAVAERTGASLVQAIAAVAAQLAEAREVARTVAAELAAPRATGRVMATLPVVGLLLGFGFGGNPVAFLLGSPGGWGCLLGGVALACAGVLWTELLADRAGGA